MIIAAANGCTVTILAVALASLLNLENVTRIETIHCGWSIGGLRDGSHKSTRCQEESNNRGELPIERVNDGIRKWKFRFQWVGSWHPT
ncbi:hypothetical protein BDV59DRAFT_170735 [Aspergillus ambiguus]|uniref:uncharacterized protein n=1 Tax=Aspergillus ambiguus TaxID=176160 RepID=UPI003CCE05D7